MEGFQLTAQVTEIHDKNKSKFCQNYKIERTRDTRKRERWNEQEALFAQKRKGIENLCVM